jgi:hypothetical protein
MTSRIINSGTFFERLIRDEDIRRWLELVYKKWDVYLVVDIHSFSDTPGSGDLSDIENPAVLDDGERMSPFSTPGNRIIGVRYRRVRFRGFRSSSVDSAFLEHCGRWKKYIDDDENRGNEQPDSLEATLDDRSVLEDLRQGYDSIGIYHAPESGETFVELVISY